MKLKHIMTICFIGTLSVNVQATLTVPDVAMDEDNHRFSEGGGPRLEITPPPSVDMDNQSRSSSALTTPRSLLREDTASDGIVIGAARKRGQGKYSDRERDASERLVIAAQGAYMKRNLRKATFWDLAGIATTVHSTKERKQRRAVSGERERARSESGVDKPREGGSS